MLMTVERAVPWFSRAKNREKSCERYYLPVCSHLTRKGDRLKRLDGHENWRRLGMRAFSFFCFETMYISEMMLIIRSGQRIAVRDLRPVKINSLNHKGKIL
jgi:hypothetical protein